MQLMHKWEGIGRSPQVQTMVVEAGHSRAVYEPQTTMRCMEDNHYDRSAQSFATAAVKSIFLSLQLFKMLYDSDCPNQIDLQLPPVQANCVQRSFDAFCPEVGQGWLSIFLVKS